MYSGVARLVMSPGESRVNRAVTEIAPLPLTVQAALPEHWPLQPSNREPASGVAMSVTGMPAMYVIAQPLPHSMPPGLLDTVPAPSPDFATTTS